MFFPSPNFPPLNSSSFPFLSFLIFSVSSGNTPIHPWSYRSSLAQQHSFQSCHSISHSVLQVLLSSSKLLHTLLHSLCESVLSFFFLSWPKPFFLLGLCLFLFSFLSLFLFWHFCLEPSLIPCKILDIIVQSTQDPSARSSASSSQKATAVLIVQKHFQK